MRFVKLVVRSFQAVESAEIELGRGLNVLYGPNDLGKSTIATALRAALLVMPGSAESARYRTWFADATPEVAVTFVDDDDRYWRVRKTFGATSGQAKSELATSKDGVVFAHDCDGRAVDEALRGLLGWGIPSPGGKGAPRGLPTSFLANVLLGEQSHVEDVLDASTEGDAASSGKERLRKALAGLAEDPWFKRVLVEAQKKVDSFFTPAGQRKRGKGSPFVHAADQVKLRGERLDELRRAVEESRAIEERVVALRERTVAARAECDEATSALAAVRKRRALASERIRAEEALGRALEEVAALDRRAVEVAEATREASVLEGLVGEATARTVETSALSAAADEAVRAAEEALRSATSEEGARRREVAKANLGTERAELATKRMEIEKRRDSAAIAQKLVAAAEAATAGKNKAIGELEEARTTEESARRAALDVEADLGLAHGIVAYGRWHAASSAVGLADAASDRAESERKRAETEDAAAEACEAEARDIEAEASAARASLPDPALTKRIEELHHRITMTEASLGGGFSIVLAGSGKAALHVATDGEAVVGGTMLDGKLVLEADKTATVSIGDLLTVEIVAGAADKRHELERLRTRWANEAHPFLERAGVTDPKALRDKKAALDGLDTKLAAIRAEARRHRAEAQTARAGAMLEDERRSMLAASAEEAGALEGKLGSHDRALLADYVERLGSKWREQAEALVSAKEAASREANAALEKAGRALELAQYRVEEAEKEEARARAEASAALALLGTKKGKSAAPSPARIVADLGVELVTLAARAVAIDGELDSLATAATAEVEAANLALASARASRDGVVASHADALRRAEVARAEHERARGRVEALEKALAGVDRGALDARVVEARAVVAGFGDEPIVTAEDVRAAEDREAAARASLDEHRAEASHAEGALTKVGGAGIRDELRRESEAYSLAKERQHDLEVDADAWRLLRETLTEVEKEGSTHLGRSLAAPVSARLSDLTRDRYASVRLDQHLRAETVDVVAARADDDVLAALSVGTRDQLATLLRLTIAERLSSAIVLDDHLVHTDPTRLAWFRDTLRSIATTTQIVVITCRPLDYTEVVASPESPTRDVAGGMTRVIDAARVIRRFGPAPKASDTRPC